MIAHLQKMSYNVQNKEYWKYSTVKQISLCQSTNFFFHMKAIGDLAPLLGKVPEIVKLSMNLMQKIVKTLLCWLLLFELHTKSIVDKDNVFIKQIRYDIGWLFIFIIILFGSDLFIISHLAIIISLLLLCKFPVGVGSFI